ncbi:hypothetical protein HDIA_3016 [Hartmannibacter diazotrophicus]|uniref:DUF58 domain-containing protein n=1 Tax=Hartmannibacter diazotrophicus TaxID=1482074 RepID=A0A2C9D8C5_9HYPH|nr:DUF58 domain-containing protein [Hartmannibacter diazotrophicus]SON56557.1 hypothetical protein HDIA_3016 [Hartmannibacter diazotrophicus]
MAGPGATSNRPEVPLTPAMTADARALAAALPDLLVEARQVANSVSVGWHGRRRAGVGEDFWQFRPFNFGEPARRIDWRRSARDEHLYVREREMETAHTVWLWADLSPSMRYRSTASGIFKRDRAVILMVALAELLARSGERVGLLGHGHAVASRMAAEQLAMKMSHLDEETQRPTTTGVRRFHEVVLFGDFFEDQNGLAADLTRLAGAGARVHLVQILDPAEETFPFGGRTEFRDPESGERLTAGRAEAWRDLYLEKLAGLRDLLRQETRRPGWSFVAHHTDRAPSEVLLALHQRLAAMAPHAGVAGGAA